MLTYNRPQFMRMAIDSIFSQEFQDWELVVVHDGQNQVIPIIMSEFQHRDPRIRYFPRRNPGNIAEACNFGLSQARGQYIAVLDDDDYWADTDKLAKQVAFLDGNPDYGGCGGGVITVDTDCREHMRYLKPERDRQIKRVALMANPLAHSSSMYRLELAVKVGGYDESLAGFQDWDLWLKLGKVSKLYNFPDYTTCYRIWHGSGSFHQLKGNTQSALRITKRHRQDYPGFLTAYTIAMLYHAYAHLPVGIRRVSYGFLSRLKKSAFAHRPASALR